MKKALFAIVMLTVGYSLNAYLGKSVESETQQTQDDDVRSEKKQKTGKKLNKKTSQVAKEARPEVAKSSVNGTSDSWFHRPNGVMHGDKYSNDWLFGYK